MSTRVEESKAETKTTAQKVVEMPPPVNSEECAYRIKQFALDIAEDHRRIANVFHIWVSWFTQGPVPTADWFEEVWRYLPKNRWNKGRILGYLFMYDDKRVRDMTKTQTLNTDVEALIWLGNPNSRLTIANRVSAFAWMRKVWKEAEKQVAIGDDEKVVRVDKDSLARNFRRQTPPRPHLHFERKHPAITLSVVVNDESASDAKVVKAVEYVMAGGYERGTIVKSSSGNYSERRPSFAGNGKGKKVTKKSRKAKSRRAKSRS